MNLWNAKTAREQSLHLKTHRHLRRTSYTVNRHSAENVLAITHAVSYCSTYLALIIYVLSPASMFMDNGTKCRKKFFYR